MSRVLIDTNVLIYSIDTESKYFKQSQYVIFNNEIEIFTTSKNLSEFLSVVTRFPEKQLSIDDALIIIKDFKSIFNVLYPSVESFTIFQELLKKYQPTGLVIHDFEIISICLVNQVKTIATVNQKDFNQIEEIDLYSF